MESFNFAAPIPAFPAQIMISLRPDEHLPSSPAVPGTCPDEEQKSGRKFSILLVEDNPADVLLVREALDLHGVNATLTVVDDGEKAIDLVDEVEDSKRPCPHLLILDLNLPRKPGLAVLEHFRQSRRCGRVPVLVLSSSGARKDTEEAAALGATRYVRKAFNLEEFLAVGAVVKELLFRPPM